MKMFFVQCDKWEPNIRSSRKLTGFSGRRTVTEPSILRTVYAKGLFYYYDALERDELPIPPAIITATGRAYVDLIFYTEEDDTQPEDPLGSWTFLDDKKTALELTIAYPASFFNWAMDILHRSEGDKSSLLVHAKIEELKQSSLSSDDLDTYSRLSDGKLDHIYLSAGPKRLKAQENL